MQTAWASVVSASEQALFGLSDSLSFWRIVTSQYAPTSQVRLALRRELAVIWWSVLWVLAWTGMNAFGEYCATSLFTFFFGARTVATPSTLFSILSWCSVIVRTGFQLVSFCLKNAFMYVVVWLSYINFAQVLRSSVRGRWEREARIVRQQLEPTLGQPSGMVSLTEDLHRLVAFTTMNVALSASIQRLQPWVESLLPALLPGQKHGQLVVGWLFFGLEVAAISALQAKQCFDVVWNDVHWNLLVKDAWADHHKVFLAAFGLPMGLVQVALLKCAPSLLVRGGLVDALLFAMFPIWMVMGSLNEKGLACWRPSTVQQSVIPLFSTWQRLISRLLVGLQCFGLWCWRRGLPAMLILAALIMATVARLFFFQQPLE